MFDTNVIVSALLLVDSTPRQVLDAVVARGRLLISHRVLAELYEVLSRKKFKRYIDEGDLRNFLAAFTRHAEWIDVAISIKACRDPRDNKFLELAVCGRASHIVTGDSDLLELNPFQGIEILRPQTLLKSLTP